MHWFQLLDDARDKIERWRQDYNEFKPTVRWTTGLLASSGQPILKPEISSLNHSVSREEVIALSEAAR
ncbi:transposase [Laribacter hongkongensis]|nr:transposase [Laribacter hongkongensis]MCG9087252.1 transposase [Laribacter hongkongensis]